MVHNKDGIRIIIKKGPIFFFRFSVFFVERKKRLVMKFPLFFGLMVGDILSNLAFVDTNDITFAFTDHLFGLQ